MEFRDKLFIVEQLHTSLLLAMLQALSMMLHNKGYQLRWQFAFESQGAHQSLIAL
jgi:hypothetical protein